MTTKVRPSVLADTAVTPTTYGGSTQHAVFTVDAQGRLTYAGNATPSIATSQLTGTIGPTQVAAGTYGISVSGNSGSVTNGVYTNGSYADPAWITSLSKSKVGLGNVDNTADANKSVNYATSAGSAATATTATTATTAGNGGVTSVNGSTGAVTVSVAGTTAGLSAGAVGSYAFLWADWDVGGAAGATVAGSSLRYTNGNGYASGAVSGTWRRMGYTYNMPDYALASYATVYLRIS